MKKWLLCLIFYLCAFFCSDPVLAMDRSSFAYYKEKYGSVTASDDPLVIKAHEVFEHITGAADKTNGNYPKLLIIPEKINPWALCLKDGTVVLSQKALKLCYTGGSDAIKSARLAFLLGHEVAHLAKGDFLHEEIWRFMKRFDHKDERQKKLLNNSDADKHRELMADYLGMLYAFMAGYDPKVILQPEDSNFFKKWSVQTNADISDDHPSPEMRTKSLIDRLKTIYHQIEIFRLGLRLYQKGDYDYALKCLIHVQRHFSSREVFNTIGLIHFQKAMDSLFVFDKEKALRFKLATILDTDIRLKKSTGSHVVLKEMVEKKKLTFSRELQAAITNFKEACRRDDYYVPSRVNLSSAYILSDKYFHAMAELIDADEIVKNDLNVLNNKAVIFYDGPCLKIEESIRQLNRILKADPGYSAALYNLGRILFEQNRHLEAQEKWCGFLKNEPGGSYANKVRENCACSEKRPPICDKSPPPPPIELRFINKNIRAKLEEFETIDLDSIIPDGTYYFKDDITLFAIRGRIKIEEAAYTKETKSSEILMKYGAPNRIIDSVSGMKVYVYRNFAMDIKEGKAHNIIHFSYE